MTPTTTPSPDLGPVDWPVDTRTGIDYDDDVAYDAYLTPYDSPATLPVQMKGA